MLLRESTHDMDQEYIKIFIWYGKIYYRRPKIRWEVDTEMDVK
jgi:hypothetical protein